MQIRHRLSAHDPSAHLVEIETTVSGPDVPSPLELAFPIWTPGSYLVREYARHIEGMSSSHPVEKVRKNAWRIDHGGLSEVTVRYRVYCNDLSVRTNHVDATHIYVNGAATFPFVPGHLDAGAELEVAVPQGWKVSTALPFDGSVHRASSVDVLIDSPIEIGTQREETFVAAGKVHTVAIWPDDCVRDSDVARMVEAMKTIVETEARLFGGSLPHDGYVFILHFSPRGRGGLEHLSSSTLLASPASFDAREGFLDLLSLIAHEYFHLWNVKRIRPQGLTPYRYEEENYTRQLWWFEGATSYYDWRVLRLAKLCTVEEYLEHLAGEIAHLDQTPGRLVHALEDASFDAWIKLYRPDENSPNSTISYYRKGELVCALLDLEIRGRTHGRVSLDHVLFHLWERHGNGEPVPEGAMQSICESIAETPLGDLFDAWIRSAKDIDPAPTLARAGLMVERAPKSEAPSLGIRTRESNGRVFVTHVPRGGAGHRAAIDVGDEILAIASRRVEGPLEPVLSKLTPEQRVPVLVGRDGHVRTLEAKLDPPRADRVRLTARKDATTQQKALFEHWLSEAHPAWK